MHKDKKNYIKALEKSVIEDIEELKKMHSYLKDGGKTAS